MSAFQWLNDLFRSLSRIFPRLTLVPPTHHGVLFGPKGGAVRKSPGLIFWWPIAYKLRLVPSTVQSIQISVRCLPCKHDGIIPRVSICGMSAQYRVEDPIKAVLRCTATHSLVENRAMAELSKYWSGIDGAVESIGSVRAALTTELAWYGINLERLDIAHSGEAVCVVQIADVAYNDAPYESVSGMIGADERTTG